MYAGRNRRGLHGNAGRGDFVIFGVPSGSKIGLRSDRARGAENLKQGTCGNCRQRATFE